MVVDEDGVAMSGVGDSNLDAVFGVFAFAFVLVVVVVAARDEGRGQTRRAPGTAHKLRNTPSITWTQFFTFL